MTTTKTLAALVLLMMLALGACSYKLRVVRSYPFKLRPEDSVFIDRTVAVYDAFVRSRMGDTLPTGEAYRHFFVENAAKVESAGDIGDFMPDSTFVYQWTDDLISNRMYTSLVEHHYFLPKFSHGPQQPGRWYYGPKHPKFVEFCRELGKSNNFWKDFADSVEAAGGISPTCYAALINLSEEINFDNKHERFLAVIAFMTGCLDHRDFNLVKDVARNDSLKAALQIEIERIREDSLYDEN